MNSKLLLLALGWASALGISYFAFDLLTSLGDWAAAWGREPTALVASLVVAVVPVCLVWLGIILIEAAASTKRAVWTLVLTSALAWVWLYVGSIIVALMRLQ